MPDTPPPDHFPFRQTTDPDVRLYEVNDAHWYVHMPTVTWMRSVTAVTGVYPKGQGFNRWLASKGSIEAADQEKQEGGDRGTLVHSAVCKLLEGEPILRKDQTEEVYRHLVAFHAWYASNMPEVFASEAVVYDLRRRIAGTLDIACILGKPTIVDLKTSSKLYNSMKVQVEAYGRLWNAQGFQPQIEQVALLRTGSKHKAGYEFWIDELSERRWKLFQSLHWVSHDHDPTMEPSFPDPVPEELRLPTVGANFALAADRNGSKVKAK